METVPTTQLAEFVNKTELEPATKESLIKVFEPFMQQALEYKDKADAIKVDSIEDVQGMKDAREGRLFLKNIRVAIEKKRKEEKEDSLKKGKAIDMVAGMLTDLIEPIEKDLKEKEEYKERFMAKLRADLKEKRMAELKGADVDGSLFGLDLLPEEQYQQLLANSIIAKTDREKKAEEEKLRLEAEEKQREADKVEAERKEAEAREAQRVENEKLKAENEAKEAQLAKEREIAAIQIREERRIAAEKQAAQEKELADQKAKAEAERKTAALKAEAERQAQEKILAQEREERAKIERELKAKAEAELKAKEEEAVRLEVELSKGDAAKFEDFIKDLESLKSKYQFKSAKYKKLYEYGIELLDKAVNYLIAKK